MIKVYKYCNTNCIFFPNKDMIKYKVDENGLKKRLPEDKLKCYYDGHTILSWKDICPYYKDKIDHNYKE